MADDGETGAPASSGTQAGPQAANAKAPKTERGRRTLRKLLDAAALEFGERGFHEASIAGVTSRGGLSIGTFYVYFDSKEAIFRALVADMGRLTRGWIGDRIKGAPDRLTAERVGVTAYIEFVRQHKNLHRIVTEAHSVAPDAYRAYYETFAEAYRRNLEEAAARGEISDGDHEERAWALIGIGSFLGWRYAIWSDDVDIAEIGAAAGDLIENGLAPRPPFAPRKAKP
jgi:AcrR family transcriptional regulator